MRSINTANQEGWLESEIIYRSSAKERLQNLLISLVLILLSLTIGLTYKTVVEQINNAVIAIQVGLLPKTSPTPFPVIVEVDEKSLTSYGQWPWPRYQVAKLLDAIRQSAPASVGVDALFIERDRTSPSEIHNVLERDFNQSFSLDNIQESLRNNDVILANSLKSGAFVMGYLFTFDQTTQHACKPRSATGAWFSAGGETQSSLSLQTAENALCNIPILQQSATASGFINATPDSDGIYRKIPMVIAYKNRLYPSLALQTYLTAKSLDHFILSPSETGLLLQAGNIQIPLDSKGNLRLKFPIGQSFERISAFDLLSGKVNVNRLVGKIVLVGFSAAGLHEFRPTPYAAQFLGVEFHATAVDNLLREDFLQRPDQALVLEFGISVILGLSLIFTLTNANPKQLVLIPVLQILLVALGSQLLLIQTGIIISPALPVIMTLFSLLIFAILKYARKHNQAKEMALTIANAHEGIIESLNSMADSRDPETGAHIKRTQNYIKALAYELKKHPKFKSQLTNEIIKLLYKAAPLHDLGKVGIRDHILLKPGRLESDEFEIMKAHPQIGANIILSVAKQSGLNPFMQYAHQICLYHHEKWDGSGYPNGLVGEQIPLSARLMALADVYDALICKRVYKKPFSHQQAISMIKEGKGKHFDPLVVEAFESIQDEFMAIALQFLDSDDQRETLLAEIK
ncbi:CHASE2 domain-containing protein [Methylomonas sp. AM2-LC]|uniref:CHASE2 domain-containing protein n=1 Tax=Methylomonas sp. AM2-LC TaxID=3153301 RepID=UPI0032674EA9